jgi:hypothetical protein
MSLDAAERRKVREELVAQFMRREIEWKTLLAVWEPEPHEPPEPVDPDEELDKVRLDIVKADHQIAMLQKFLRESEETRKEIERLWRERPALEKQLGRLLKKLCEARRCAVERLPQWEKLKEECIAFGLEIEGQKGADCGAGSQTESA